MSETEIIENGETRDKSLIPKDFLERILRKRIVDYKTGGGSNPGDNFTSILISLEIRVVEEEKPLHLLFKTFPHHPTRQKLLEDTNLFLKEYLMYNTWIPELIRFQTEMVGNDKILKPSVPQLVAGNAINYENVEEVENNADPMLSNFILMVDERKTNGFKMADKTKSLDFDHVKLVLEEVSKLHALGYAYKVHKGLENVRNNFTFYVDPFFRNIKQKATLDGMTNSNATLIKEALHEFLKSNPHLSEGIDRFTGEDEVFDLLYMFLDPEGMDEEKVESMLRLKPKEYAGTPPLKDQWIVAGHGDCWTNNMIFKYDEMGKVTNTILVDLQITRESCVMADIVYFIYTSTDTSFRKKHLQEALRWYFEKFEEYCIILKVEPFPGFTWENFQRKFHRSKIFGFLFALLVLPIILSDPESAVDLDTIEINGDLKEEEEFVKMFSESSANDTRKMDRLKERFTALLMELYEEGVL